MRKFYFLYGSTDKNINVKTGYVVVEADDEKDAIDTFRAKYQYVLIVMVDCNFISMYHKDDEPMDILISKKVTKQKRMSELIEKTLRKVMDELIGTTEDFKEEWLETEIGTTVEELEELGVNIKEMMRW